jgi:hypothetical protein
MKRELPKLTVGCSLGFELTCAACRNSWAWSMSYWRPLLKAGQLPTGYFICPHCSQEHQQLPVKIKKLIHDCGE